MLLVMDVGNSNIVIGIFEDQTLQYHWRLATDWNKTEDEYGTTLKMLLRDQNIQIHRIEGVIISSVVPPIMYVLEKMVKKYLGQKPLIVGPGIKTGLNMKLDQPKEVGADLIVNAVAGITYYGAPLIIVDFGTATTFSVINEETTYLGGAISPGVTISMEALVQNAAKLPKIEIIKPDGVIGKNTIKAMQSGVFYGYVGLVDGMVSRLKKELREKPKVIATGGLAELMSVESDSIQYVDPFLTLKGLHIIYDRNR